LIKPKQPILFLEKFDLTPTSLATLASPSMAAWPVATASVVALRSHVVEQADFEQAEFEWRTNKKILGGIFLIRDCQKIWISNTDLEYFERAKTNED
jgi:hypothetical protein